MSYSKSRAWSLRHNGLNAPLLRAGRYLEPHHLEDTLSSIEMHRIMKISFQVQQCNSSTTHNPINGTVVTLELGRFGWTSCVFSSAEKSIATFLQWSTEGGQWLLGSVWSAWHTTVMQSYCCYSIHIMEISTLGLKAWVIIAWPIRPATTPTPTKTGTK